MDKLLRKLLTFAMIILVVFTAIRIIGTPMSLKARSDMCFRNCTSNMRSITGAIEMYNMDHPNARMTYDAPFAANEEKLINSGYLKSAVHCPGSFGYAQNSFLRFICGIYLHTEGLPIAPGEYSAASSAGSNLSISCTLHGKLMPDE